MNYKLTTFILLFSLFALTLAGCASNSGTEGVTEQEKVSTSIPTIQAVAPSVAAIPPTLIGEEGMISYYEIELEEGTVIEYGVVLPDGFDASQTYPILLALPPGGQTQSMVVAGIDGFWGEEGKKRGWIVISPIAPNGTLFFQGSERLIPEFLAQMSQQYQAEGGKYHLAGISNGGISTFRVGGNHPELFHSMMVLPGFPRSEEDFQNLDLLTDMPVTMFVGEGDTSWIPRMQETEERLSALGGQVSLEIVADEGHLIRSLQGGERLYDLLESFR